MENSFGQNKRAKIKKKVFQILTHAVLILCSISIPLDDIFIPERCTRVVCHTAILDSKARSVGKLCVYV